MKKKILFLLIFASLIFYSTSFVSAKNFTDTQETIFQNAIDDLSNKGIIQGYDDGSYRPFDTINRAEFTKIVIESYYPNMAVGSNCFPDIHDEWFAKYVCFAQSKNIISGYIDNSFKPSNPINLAEALKIVLETYKFDIPTSSYEKWYEKYYWFAQPKGFLNQINPAIDRNITRGEMA